MKEGTMTKSLSIIIGSTRTNRVGRAIAEWVSSEAKAAGFDTVEFLDLKEIALPKFDAPVPTMYAPIETPEVRNWGAQVDAAGHILVLTPEYNRGVPADLKAAIDSLYGEWDSKPTAIVSYGYMGGGANAGSHLRDTLTHVKTNLVEQTAAIQLSETLVSDGAVQSDQIDDATKAALSDTLTTLAAK